MPRLDDIYRKFGETAEAVQLLETELGTMLLSVSALEEDLLTGTKPDRAAEILNEINSGTLGRILNRLKLRLSGRKSWSAFCMMRSNNATVFRIPSTDNITSGEIRMKVELSC